MDKEKSLEQARRALDLGDSATAYSILRPLAGVGEPEALFLCATLSFPPGESDDDFEKRSIEYLTKAAESSFPPAQYALGVCYDLGDLVKYDPNFAGLLFKKAADAGHSASKFCHGRNLFYGSNGFYEDKVRGLALISEAANDGVDDAVEFLRHFESQA